MLIRAYQTKDQTAIIALWKACNLLVPWNNPMKDIARKLNVGADLFLIGKHAKTGEIIASIMGGFEGHRGWVNYLAVSPKHQKLGHGRAMMHALETRLRDKGCPKINLQVRSNNAATLAFYESIGYKQDKCISLGKRLELDLEPDL